MSDRIHLQRPGLHRLPGHGLYPWAIGFLGMVAVSVMFCGCAISRAHLTETAPDGTRRDLQLNNYATLFTTQTVEKQRASIGKTLSAGTSGLDQQSDSTNLVNVISAVAEGVVKGLK